MLRKLFNVGWHYHNLQPLGDGRYAGCCCGLAVATLALQALTPLRMKLLMFLLAAPLTPAPAPALLRSRLVLARPH